MSMLSTVTRGKVRLPHLLLIHSPDGIGKSTFAAGAPSVVFLGPELGSANLDVARFPTPKTWVQFMSAIDELITGDHNFKSLAVDSLDWLESLCYEHICGLYKVDSIEKAASGFGKGYREGLNHMVSFRNKLSELREKRKMNIILICHSKLTQFNDPQTENSYGRYELQLQESQNISIKAMWKQYVDNILFANFETFSKGEGKTARGISTRERKLFTERDAAFDAKNRFSLPYELELSWEAYEQAMNESQHEEPSRIMERIVKLCEKVDEELKNKVMEQVEKWKTESGQLLKIEQRLITKLGE